LHQKVVTLKLDELKQIKQGLENKVHEFRCMKIFSNMTSSNVVELVRVEIGDLS